MSKSSSSQQQQQQFLLDNLHKRLENYSSKGKVVPWYDWSEWLHLKNQIFSNRPMEMKRAQTRLEIWKNRNARLPHPIECTLDILQILSSSSTSSSTSSNHHSLMMAMSMVIVRFVNGFLETHQKISDGISPTSLQNRYKNSIATLMEKLKIPRAIVDVRHEVTHGTMPSHTHIQHTIQLCFQWLRVHYWEAQAQQLKNDCQLLLISIQDWRSCCQIMSDADVVPQVKWDQASKRLQSCSNIVNRIMLFDVFNRSFFVRLFVIHDLLSHDLFLTLTSEKKSSKTMKNEKSEKKECNRALLVQRAQESIPLFIGMQNECLFIMVYVIRYLALILLEKTNDELINVYHYVNTMNHESNNSDSSDIWEGKRKLAAMWFAIILNDDYLKQIVKNEEDVKQIGTELNQLFVQLIHFMDCYQQGNNEKQSDNTAYFVTVRKVISSSSFFTKKNKNSTTDDDDESMGVGEEEQQEWQRCAATTNHYFSGQMVGTSALTIQYATALQIPEAKIRNQMIQL